MSKLDQLKALGDAKRVSRNRNDEDNRSTARKADKSPHRAVGSGDVRLGEIKGDRSIDLRPTAKLKSGRPRITEQRPWEAEGISRRTWYRKRHK